KILVPAWPGIRWIEDLRRHFLAFEGHLEAKDRILSVRHLEQRAAERGVEQGAGGMVADAFADAKRSARPARIYQPHVRAVLLDLFLQQFGIGQRVMHHEGAAKAGAE